MSLENLPDLLRNISEDGVKTEEIHSYQFKSFTLKPVERQLLDGGRSVPLTPKAFDILTLLIVNAGHLVTKEEILNTIWAGSFVEEANLPRLVHTIRKTLGEDENGDKFIETVPTKGYRFVAEIEKVIAPLREAKDTIANDGSEEFWPDRLEVPSSGSKPALEASGDKKSPSRWLLAGMATVVAVGLVVAFAVWRNDPGSAPATVTPVSIAVLPLRPIGPGERDLTYDLAFANSVITDLSQSKNLRVRSFSMMRSFTDVTQDPIDIGKDRGVDYVLESNYLSNGGRLQVTSNLINVRNGSVDATFKNDFAHTDLYAGARNVAAKIVPDILAKLGLDSVAPGNHGTDDEKAWRSYLQGMNLTNKRTVEDAEKGDTRVQQRDQT